MKQLILFVFLLGCFLPGRAQSSADPFSRDQRVCFVGNSITHYGRYHQLVGLYYQTRFPGHGYRAFNCGIGSDASRHISARFQEDVLSKQPGVIVIMIGSNDAWGTYYNDPDTVMINEKNSQKLATFKSQMAGVIDQISAYGPEQVTLVVPSPYDQTAELPVTAYVGRNDMIRMLGEHIQELSTENGYGYIDLNTPMLEINSEMQQQDPSWSICGTDRVHPGWPGNTVMAYHILVAQGLKDVPVARVDIDLAGQHVLSAEGCELSELEICDTLITWTYLPEALPFPMISGDQHGSFSDGLDLVPFADELNREVIRVSGLDGLWSISIDGFPVDTVRAEELDSGVNLGFNMLSPMQAHSQEVLQISNQAYNYEKLIRGGAYIAHRLLPTNGLNTESDFDDQQLVIDEWIAGQAYRESWAKAYWEIYHDDAKKDSIFGNLEAFFVEIDEMSQPGTYQVELLRLDTVYAQGISLSPDRLELEVGEDSLLEITFEPADSRDQQVDYSSEDPAVASVDASGRVLALDKGNTRIIATSRDGGYQASCELEVRYPLGIGKANTEPDLKAFPNPASDKLYISTGKYLRGTLPNYYISDLRGRTLLQGKLQHESLNELQLEHIPPGTYILQLSQGTYRSRQILLIQP